MIRRGTTVADVDPRTVTARQLAELMVGSELPSPQTQESTVTDRAPAHHRGHLASTTRPAGARCSSDIELTIHAGEIVGIAGVEGNGQAELVEVIMGMREPSSGRILLGDVDISDWQTREMRARPASATSPRTGTATGCCSRRRCGRTSSSATRPSRPTPRAGRLLDQRERGQGRDRSGRQGVRRAHARRST